MSDFIAHVKAELDTSEAEKKLNNLTGKNYKVNINTGDSAKSVDNVNQSLQNTQRSANNLGNALKKPFQVGSSAALAAKGIQLINTAARNATDAIKDVDSAITDLRMATNESYDTVSKWYLATMTWEKLLVRLQKKLHHLPMLGCVKERLHKKRTP